MAQAFMRRPIVTMPECHVIDMHSGSCLEQISIDGGAMRSHKS